MDNFGPEDLQIPELKLIQNVGGDWAKTLGAEPGDFFLSLSDEVLKAEEGLDIVLVDIKKVRTYWGRTEIEDAPPECQSLDAGTAANPGFGTEGQDCKTCPYRSDTPWLLDTLDRRSKCTIDYNLICINMKDGNPFIFRASGISAQPVKELFTNLKMNKQLKGEVHRAVTHATSLKKKTAAGEAYAIHFSKPTLLGDESAKQTFLLSQEILGMTFALPQGEEELLHKEPAPQIQADPVTTPEQHSPTDARQEKPPETTEIDMNF